MSESDATFTIPTNHKYALTLVADERSTAFERATVSDIGREAIEEWFQNHADELPEQARNILDDDLFGDEGGDDE